MIYLNRVQPKFTIKFIDEQGVNFSFIARAPSGKKWGHQEKFGTFFKIKTIT